MSLKDDESQSRWNEFFEALPRIERPTMPTPTSTNTIEVHDSIFVQKKVEFNDNGNFEVVTERVPAAKVSITSFNGESGGFETEVIISPDQS